MTQVAYEIPMTPGTPQKVTVTLSGVQYQLTTRWCPPSACWVVDVVDISGNPLISGIPVITGIDLLAQYEYLGIPGKLLAQTDTDALAVPTFDNFGSLGHLYYVVQQ